MPIRILVEDYTNQLSTLFLWVPARLLLSPSSLGRGVETRKDLSLRRGVFVGDRRPPPARPEGDSAAKRPGADQETLTVPGRGSEVGFDRLPVRPHGGLDGEGPDDFGDGEEQIPFGQVDPRTDSSTRPVPIMIASFVAGGRGELGGQGGRAPVMIGVKGVVVGVAPFVVMQAPGVDDDDRPLRNVVAVDPVVSSTSVSRPAGDRRERESAHLRRPHVEMRAGPRGAIAWPL